MSAFALRLAIGPIVVCDIEFFATQEPVDDAPPQLAGGAGSIVEPYVAEIEEFGFTRARRRVSE